MSRMAVALVAAAGLAATCTPGPTAPAAPVASPVTPTTLDIGTLDVATYADVVPEPVTTTTTVAEPVTVPPTTSPPRVRAVPTTEYEPPMGERTVRGGAPPKYISDCESGGSPTAVNPNGHYGKWQFSISTWQSVGGTGRPDYASEAEQDNRAAILWDGGRGAGQWACS